jgi:HEAT repeat protein
MDVDEAARLVEGPAPACWRGFKALGEAGDARSLRLLREQLGSHDWTRRRAATIALAGHRMATEASRDLRAALSDPSPYVVRAAADAAAAVGDRASRPRLLALLGDPEPDTRASAVCALGALWDSRDVAAMIRLAQTDSSTEVRKQASWVLHEHATSAKWEDLFGLWSKSGVPRERIWATELAAAFGGPAVAGLLQPFLTDADGHVRRAAQRLVSRDIQQR